MSDNMRIILIAMCTLVLSGCVTTRSCDDNTEVRLIRTQTEFMVNNGIRNYEDGNYSASMGILQSLVENRAATKSEKLLAYKYLAFNHCISPTESRDTRERMCRDSFRRAFEINPNFSLTQAEAGHPVWGPIFSSVRNKMSK